MATLPALLFAAPSPERAEPVTTVPEVDLQRYVGTWHEVARFPNWFQKHCASEVTATYALRADGRVDVVNRCRRADGSAMEAAGVARPAHGDRTNARLEVRFAPAFLSFIPAVWGDYWVVGLAPDYSWAVVGDPGRHYLWILSRSPVLAAESYEAALDTAVRNGYPVERLVRSRGAAAPAERP